jgi:3D (Asp-Asp-Asp) domain-containing protein
LKSHNPNRLWLFYFGWLRGVEAVHSGSAGAQAAGGFRAGLGKLDLMHALFKVAPYALCGLVMLTSCSTLQKTPPEKLKILTVTATAFNSIAGQGQGNPNVGAWGDRIAPGLNAVAVSADLIPLGLVRGTRVRIEGLENDYVVLDRMPARWKKRIDIYMGNDVKAARAWGKREVKIHWTVQNNPNP